MIRRSEVCLVSERVAVTCKVTISRTGLFGNVTVYWSVNGSASDVQTELYLHPSSGSVSLLSGLFGRFLTLVYM